MIANLFVGHPEESAFPNRFLRQGTREDFVITGQLSLIAGW